MAQSAYNLPPHRPLQIFDPMISRTSGRKGLTLQVINEPLAPGPIGYRLHVIDYDGAAKKLYEPVDLDNAAVLMNDGLTPTESDPRFHQQMVYAVASKVLEFFELALGRRILFYDRKPLRLYPHAFEGSNAFYDPQEVAVYFGYFLADETDPGPNLPGQTVFSCLSHDIIAHEVTHALVHRLRKRFIEPSNKDVLAFHEAFSDLVAIFHHFTFEEVLSDTIQKTRSALRSPSTLLELASQFGWSTGQGTALRTALDPDGKPDPQLMQTLLEPHDRGSILVAAVFDAFFVVYQRRIQDLVRIATGGTGTLPPGDLHPDLVGRIAKEASKTAKNILTMCIRAFEYLPPVDISYGDFLRALVTADFEAVPDDGVGLRAAMIESFRQRGIYPEGSSSLAEDALIWRGGEGIVLPLEPYKESLAENAIAFDRWGKAGTVVDRRGATNRWAGMLVRWANGHGEQLGLDPNLKTSLLGFHELFRISPEGQLGVELVAQFEQIDRDSLQDPDFGGVPLRGGITVIGGAEGDVRHIIRKPITKERAEKQKAYVSVLDREDPALAWAGAKYERGRMKVRTRFSQLHRNIR